VGGPLRDDDDDVVFVVVVVCFFADSSNSFFASFSCSSFFCSARSKRCRFETNFTLPTPPLLFTVPPLDTKPVDSAATIVVLLLLLLFRFLPPNSNIFTLRSFVWMDVTYHDDS